MDGCARVVRIPGAVSTGLTFLSLRNLGQLASGLRFEKIVQLDLSYCRVPDFEVGFPPFFFCFANIEVPTHL